MPLKLLPNNAQPLIRRQWEAPVDGASPDLAQLPADEVGDPITTLTNDAGISLTNKGAASQTVDGGGMLTIKGGLVQVN